MNFTTLCLPATGWLSLGLCIALTGCRSEENDELGRLQTNRSPTEQFKNEVRLTAEQIRINQIQTAEAQEESVVSSLVAIGRVLARAGGEAQVFSPFVGRLVADPAKLPRVGNPVRKGEVLAEVEQLFNASEKLQVAATTTQLQGSIQQAEHEVGYRQTEFDRARQLYEGGAIPLKQLQATELSLKQGQTQLEAAVRTRKQYEQAAAANAVPRRESILAPIDGVVVAADLIAGSQIEPSKSLLTIIDLNTVWVEVAIHETDLHAIQRAQEARITTRANPGRTYTGQLVTVGNLVDIANRTVTAVFTVGNPDRSLKIGMYAEARIPTSKPSKALTVPSSAVLSDEHLSSVFVESRPGVFVRRGIEPGDQAEGKVIVKSGLGLGEKVVIHGAQILRGEFSKSQIQADND